jgi:hypothetical protein
MFIMLEIICMATMAKDTSDVKSAFLNGTFSKGERLCKEALKGLNDSI